MCIARSNAFPPTLTGCAIHDACCDSERQRGLVVVGLVGVVRRTQGLLVGLGLVVEAEHAEGSAVGMRMRRPMRMEGMMPSATAR